MGVYYTCITLKKKKMSHYCSVARLSGFSRESRAFRASSNAKSTCFKRGMGLAEGEGKKGPPLEWGSDLSNSVNRA